MNRSRRTEIFYLDIAGTILGCTLLLGAAFAQDSSVTRTAQSGPAMVQTDVKSGVVTYVSGNDLVVTTDDGQVRHFVVPDSTTVTVNSKQLTVHDLTPGMRLTRTITTTSVPRTVTTVRTIQGTVFHVTPPRMVILRLPDGNKQYKVPKGQMFDVDGQKRDVFALRRGMNISATVITESPEVVATDTRHVSGEGAPAPPTPPDTPPLTGALLIAVPVSAPEPAHAEVAENTLPKTGSMLPLVGLLGLLSIGASCGIRAIRP